jgi:bacteriocin-like protein
MPPKKPAPTKSKSKKGKKEQKGRQLSDDELSKVSGGITVGTLTQPRGGLTAPLDLSIRKLSEADLLKVSGGIRLMDQGDKSRQTVCR